METLSDKRAKTAEAKQVLDFILCEGFGPGGWPDTRVVHKEFRRSEVRRILGQLNTGFVWEQDEGSHSVYKLTILGVVCTAGGEELVTLVERFVKELARRFHINPKTESITAGEIADALNLRPGETQTLGKLVASDVIGPVLAMSGSNAKDFSEWSLSMPRKMDEIVEEPDLRSWLHERIGG